MQKAIYDKGEPKQWPEIIGCTHVLLKKEKAEIINTKFRNAWNREKSKETLTTVPYYLW